MNVKLRRDRYSHYINVKHSSVVLVACVQLSTVILRRIRNLAIAVTQRTIHNTKNAQVALILVEASYDILTLTKGSGCRVGPTLQDVEVSDGLELRSPCFRPLLQRHPMMYD